MGFFVTHFYGFYRAQFGAEGTTVAVFVGDVKLSQYSPAHEAKKKSNRTRPNLIETATSVQFSFPIYEILDKTQYFGFAQRENCICVFFARRICYLRPVVGK